LVSSRAREQAGPELPVIDRVVERAGRLAGASDEGAVAGRATWRRRSWVVIVAIV
jgi:hypothetical protein